MSCILSTYGHYTCGHPVRQTHFVSVSDTIRFFWHKQQDSWNRHGKYGHFYMAMFKLLELEKNNCMNYMTTIFLEIKTRFKLKCLSTCWRRALNCLAWTSRQVCPSFIHEFSSWNGPIHFSVFVEMYILFEITTGCSWKSHRGKQIQCGPPHLQVGTPMKYMYISYVL